MMRQAHPTVAVLVVLAAFATGCASTEQYSRFAQAGTVYAATVDRLLVTAGNTGIDANSEFLLQADKKKNLTAEHYWKLSNVDEERLTTISRLRDHARLLARYFVLLNELATSDAPERAQQTIKGVAKSLNAFGTQLRRSKLVKDKEAFTSVTKLIIGFRIRGLLREELDKNKDIIWAQLETQEKLLKALAKTIQHDLTIISQEREQRLVIDPLTESAPVANPDEWVAHRRMVLTSRRSVAELATASVAARELREAFEDLVAGRLHLKRINILLTDLESILAIAEMIDR